MIPEAFQTAANDVANAHGLPTISTLLEVDSPKWRKNDTGGWDLVIDVTNHADKSWTTGNCTYWLYKEGSLIQKDTLYLYGQKVREIVVTNAKFPQGTRMTLHISGLQEYPFVVPSKDRICV